MRLSLLACLAAASLLLAAAAAPSSATENFEEADANQDGAVSLEEFKKYMSADHPANKAVCAATCAPHKATLDPYFLQSAVLQTGNKNGFLSAFTNSLVMIVATEIGDKTFFIAAIMAMKHNRSWVFLAVMLAMVVMTVLSVGIGFALPNLLPRTYTHYAAALLVRPPCAAGTSQLQHINSSFAVRVFRGAAATRSTNAQRWRVF